MLFRYKGSSLAVSGGIVIKARAFSFVKTNATA